MRKIKLLQIITKLELGGAQLSTLDLIKELDRDSYDIYLISSDEGILINDALSVPDLRVNLISTLKGEINIFNDIKCLFFIYKFIKKNNIEIVHTHSSKAGIIGRWAAKLAGVKVIIHTVHGWEFHKFQNKIKRSFYVFLERITAMITDKIISVTNYDISKGLKNKIGSTNKYNLVRYGIRKEEFGLSGNGLIKKNWGIENGSFVVGMIGCFKPQKSPLDFIRLAEKAFKQFVDIKFIMVGDGELKEKAIALTEKLNLQNKFLFLGWQRNIPEILSSFDVLVLTSLWEGLPLVFLEAMASSKPIIANDISGNREIIENGVNGFLVKPRDCNALAERVIQLAQNRNLARQMGSQGNAIFNSDFNLQQMVERVQGVYSLALEEKGVK